MGICELLTVIFVIAKILGKIDWSWWTVFIPMYISAFIYLFIILIIGCNIGKSLLSSFFYECSSFFSKFRKFKDEETKRQGKLIKFGYAVSAITLLILIIFGILKITNCISLNWWFIIIPLLIHSMISFICSFIARTHEKAKKKYATVDVTSVLNNLKSLKAALEVSIMNVTNLQRNAATTEESSKLCATRNVYQKSLEQINLRIKIHGND